LFASAWTKGANEKEKKNSYRKTAELLCSVWSTLAEIPIERKIVAEEQDRKETSDPKYKNRRGKKKERKEEVF
jgi:hypothetical protein